MIIYVIIVVNLTNIILMFSRAIQTHYKIEANLHRDCFLLLGSI